MGLDREAMDKLSDAELGRFIMVLEARADKASDEIERNSMQEHGESYTANVLRSSGKLSELRTLIGMMKGILYARGEQ